MKVMLDHQLGGGFIGKQAGFWQPEPIAALWPGFPTQMRPGWSGVFPVIVAFPASCLAGEAASSFSVSVTSTNLLLSRPADRAGFRGLVSGVNVSADRTFPFFHEFLRI